MSKLDSIRDELADKYTSDWFHDGALFQDEAVSIGFKSGWDAAMERVKPLVEALEWYVEQMPDDNILHLITRKKKVLRSTGDNLLEELYVGGQKAKEALAKFRGEE